MLKLHVPWEAKGWNFYGVAMLDNAGPASTLGRIGGAVVHHVAVGVHLRIADDPGQLGQVVLGELLDRQVGAHQGPGLGEVRGHGQHRNR